MRLRIVPLVSLVGFALALFAVYAMNLPPEREKVPISRAAVDRVIQDQEAVLGRSLTEDERALAVEAAIAEEVIVREAYREGLDIGDPQIRRALVAAGRRSLIDQSTIDGADPEAMDVAAYFEAHRDRYERPERIVADFVSFYYGMLTPEDQTAVLAQLRRGVVPASVGGGRGEYLSGQMLSRAQISRPMGRTFASEVFALEPGGWHGPILSPAAVFYFRIRERIPAGSQSLEEAEATVVEDIRADRRRAAVDEALARVAPTYRVEVEDGK